MTENTILWQTNVGSHSWRMNRPDSDIDIFTAYIIPTKDLLSGKNRGFGSHNSESKNEDRVEHEIGKIVDELIKGNINFLIGTLSPIVLCERYNKSISYLQNLKDIVINDCQTKACKNSIRGLAVHNYKKYIVGSDTAREYPITKKCNLINRVLFFGINIMNGNGFRFESVKDQTPEDVKRMLQEFDDAVATSKLPEKTDSEPFREYLYNIRMMELEGKL